MDSEFNKPVETKPIEEPHQDVKKNSITEVAKPKPKNKKILKILLIILLALIFAAFAAGATYWWCNKNSNEVQNSQANDISKLKVENTALKKQLAVIQAKNTLATDDQTTCTAKAPTAQVIESIKSSITSGNTAALEGYMAPSVNTILAASEGVGAITPAASVAAISNFISSDIKSWDYNFSLSAATLKIYGNGEYKAYFPAIAVVGKASNGKVIAFSFDCNGKISTVFMAASDSLLQ